MKKIIFSDKFGLTQAVLDGRKTMTRRTVPSKLMEKYDEWRSDVDCIALPPCNSIETLSEYLVRHASYMVEEVIAIAQSYEDVEIHKAPYNCHHPGFRNKMFIKSELMPHHIRITDIKVERLQDISEEDCLKEGILIHSAFDGKNRFKTPDLGKREYLTSTDYKDCFQFMIDKVQGKGTWNSNPYVWAYEFELID